MRLPFAVSLTFAAAFWLAVPVSAQPYTETVIHSFPPPLGGNVATSLIQASDGNLYGTAPDGGTKGAGAVFKISNLDTSPTLSVIYSFLGGNDGVLPVASLIQASDGNLYGTTYEGGSDNAGTVFKISNLATSPIESIVYSFTGGNDGGYPHASLIQASDGKLYGTTFDDGTAGWGAVFRIELEGGRPVGRPRVRGNPVPPAQPVPIHGKSADRGGGKGSRSARNRRVQRRVQNYLSRPLRTTQDESRPSHFLESGGIRSPIPSGGMSFGSRRSPVQIRAPRPPFR